MRTMVVAGIALLAAAGVVVALPGSAYAATETVQAQDFQFSPAAVNIDVGDTVEWEFTGANPHNVTAVDGAFASADMTTGTFDRGFGTAGTFAYYCTIHGDAQGNGMAGTVVVTGEPTATNTPEDDETPTEEATDTPQASVTAATSTSTPVAVTTATPPPEVMPISAPVDDTPSGGSLPVAAPRTGSGPTGNASPWHLLAVALATAGTASLGGALVLARGRVS